MDLDIKKDLTSNWFKLLQDAFCNDIAKLENNKIKSVGGRVLNFVSLSDDFISARKNIIKNIKKLNWSGGFFRKDIGYKVID